MRKDIHLIAIQGEPDRLLETIGRDAKALCEKEIPQAKCVARLDQIDGVLPAATVLMCQACLRRAVQVLMTKKGPTWLYGITTAEQADRMNAGKDEE